MKQYELIDLYIADCHDATGEVFHRSQVQLWLDENGHEEINAGRALQLHRKAPTNRVFTTMRVGMGPRSHYVVVETEGSLTPKAVREMGVQWGTESVKRGVEEARTRMAPLLARSSRARTYFGTFEEQVKLVASIFGRQMGDLLDEGEIED